jgi:hypothetical protein
MEQSYAGAGLRMICGAVRKQTPLPSHVFWSLPVTPEFLIRLSFTPVF